MLSTWLPGSPEAPSFCGFGTPTQASVVMLRITSISSTERGGDGAGDGSLICAPAPRDSEGGTLILLVYLDHCPSLTALSVYSPHSSQRSW